MAGVIDALPFFNEVDVLRARLELLRGLVDRHVVVEGNLTHQGDPKPLYLDGVQLAGPVERIRVDLTGLPGDWEREAAQRNYLHLYLRALEGAREIRGDDLVLLTDADELVNPARLPEIRERAEGGPVQLVMRMLYYGRWERPGGWHHAKACLVRDLPRDPTRDLRLRFDLPTVGDAGWHASYLGEEARLRAKVEAFAHAENREPETWERIRTGAENGTGPNGERLQPIYRPELLPGPVRRLLAG